MGTDHLHTAENAEYPSLLIHHLSEKYLMAFRLLNNLSGNLTCALQTLYRKEKDSRVVSGFLDEKGKKGLTQKLSLWIRGNLFIPDARRFWIAPSIKYLRNWLEENHVDAIVSTGPPHSMHLIAKALHEKTGIPWLADFRDPWVNIDFAADLQMSGHARKRNEKLEKEVLDSCSQVVVVGDFMAEEFRSKTANKIDVITNGYDPADFQVEIPEFLLNEKDVFSIVHTGSINDRRNHPAFWQAIQQMCSENREFSSRLKIRFIGKNDASVRRSIHEFELENYTEFIDYLPHNQIIAYQKTASVLYLSINNYGASQSGFFSPKATLTGKMFEYLAARRPILMQGPADSQAAQVISQNPANRIIGFDDTGSIKSALADLFAARNEDKNAEADERFSRITLTGELAALLDGIVQKENGK
ncbi:MAG: glycosyltransferase [Bacteroidia bacterium]